MELRAMGYTIKHLQGSKRRGERCQTTGLMKTPIMIRDAGERMVEGARMGKNVVRGVAAAAKYMVVRPW